MKTAITFLALLFGILPITAQIVRFTSPCDPIELNTDPGSCEAAVFVETTATNDDNSCEQISYSYVLTINNGGISTQTSGNGNIVDTSLPEGDHLLEVTAVDWCFGYWAVCSIPIRVNDEEPPVAYCLPGVSIIAVPTAAGGYIDIWASDFDLDSYDNCTPQDDLVFSFSEDINDQTIRRNCDDVTGLPEEFVLYVWDNNGNYSNCEVGLLLSPCTDYPTGVVAVCSTTEEGEKIEKTQFLMDCTTNVGEFDNCHLFISSIPDTCSRISLVKDINPLNGVSTFDLVLIMRHIVGRQMLSSPYKMLAADVWKSGAITTYDIVILRKLILFQLTSFPNNTSWRFVDADFTFPDPANPFASPVPESFEIDSSMNLPLKIDFIGFKVGDVNGSALPGMLTNQDADGRNSHVPLRLSVADRELRTGQSYSIDFTAVDFQSVAGLQMMLQFEPDVLRFESLQSTDRLSYLSEANFGLNQLSEGLIPFSWNSFEGSDLKKGERLFSVEFTALRDGKLSDVLGLHEGLLDAEAYREQGDQLATRGVALEFGALVKEGKSLSVEAAQPNPFTEQTRIELQLAKGSSLELQLFDVTGRTVWQQKAYFTAGQHSIIIDSADLPGAGLYYYEIQTEKETISGNVIKL